MVKLYAGLSGSGKTKEMIQAINRALEQETGSLVCIERGGKLRYDVNYKVRLIEYSEYQLEGMEALKAFISGLHAGNFDISHVFLKSIHTLTGTDDPAALTDFCAWCERFGARNSINFTLAVSDSPENVDEAMRKYL